MDLNLGDVIEFKNFEDIDGHDRLHLDEWDFPKIATVSETYTDSFRIEETLFSYSYGAVKRVFPKTEINYMEKKNIGLHVGDVVVFKNYADMSVYDTALLTEECFPESGKVTDVRSLDKGVEYFCIEGSPYNFNSGSVARLISDVNDHDLGVIRKGDEVLVKAIVKEAFNGFVKINPSIDKTDVTKILKRKAPEHFIVKEDYYGMYIGLTKELIQDKEFAKIYTSRNTANEDAADMHLNAWDVIPYDD